MYEYMINEVWKSDEEDEKRRMIRRGGGPRNERNVAREMFHTKGYKDN